MSQPRWVRPAGTEPLGPDDGQVASHTATGHEPAGGRKMADLMKVRIGTEVRCSDGPAGRLIRMLLDLESNEVTDLDVAPRRGSGRLVPFPLVAAGGHEVELKVSLAGFADLPVDFIAGVAPNSAAALRSPPPDQAPRLRFGRGWTLRAAPPKEPYVPIGATELKLDTPVRAADGHVGDFNGLAFTTGSATPTHVLLVVGHRSARRELAVPFAEVRSLVDHGVELSITRAQLLAPTIGTI
jgi:hypothetical protein